MKVWVKSLRLPITLLAGLLTIVSFKISGLIYQSWLPALTVVVIASATMVQNDWRDRFYDVGKDKTLALHYPEKFFVFTAVLWVISAILTVFVFNQNSRFGILLSFMILSGIIYSETRQIPMMPIVIVSITSASSALFPVLIGYGSFDIWLLFLMILLVIFSREIMKDLDDVSIDGNYKSTIPLMIGSFWAKVLAVSILISLVILIIVKILTNYFIGIPFFLISVLCIFINKTTTKTAKLFLDIGITITLISILFFSD